MARLFALISVLIWTAAAHGATLRTNAVEISDAPAWLRERLVDAVVARVQRSLEWDVRRVKVTFYPSQKDFERFHGQGPSVLAVTRKSDQSIHLGPQVGREGFEASFAHELAHVIVYQKYKEAIPPWLNEGLANWAARNGTVDYRWLESQKLTSVEKLSHPLAGDRRLNYMASLALMELLDKRCRVRDLLQLSVGKKLETYIRNTCGLTDLSQALRQWVVEKAKARKP